MQLPNLLDLAPVIGWNFDQTIFLWGRGAEALYGFTQAEALGQVTHELLKTRFPQPLKEIQEQLLSQGKWEGELVHQRKDGATIAVLSQWILHRDDSGHPLAILETNRDITERKQAETNQVLLTDILRILNRGGELHSLVGDALRLIQMSSGFDAVGLRLFQGEDCPYYEQNGFSQEFLREENFLCARGTHGMILRDTEGRAMLECTCGLVLSGRTDPSMSCFTQGGSFWTNVSTDLLALPREADPRTNPRNRCIHTGYQSVGLFPVRSGGDIIGVLQLNDRRTCRFTPELIAFYENLAQNIGLALQRTVAEEALRRTTERYALLAETAEALLSAPNAQTVVEDLCRKVMKHLRCEVFFNYLVDETRGQLQLNACAGIPAEEAQNIEWLDYGQAVCGCVARDRQRIIAQEILSTPDERTALVKSYGVQAYCCHPLMAGERLIGTLSFGTTQRPKFKDDEVELMRAVANQVAVAMERIRSEEKLRHAKEELDRANAGLERKVEERTAKLQEAIGELEHFSYTITHDMRAPLRAMQGFGQILLEQCGECLDQERQGYLRRIAESADRMDKLITDSLNYNKVVREELDLKPVNVTALLRGMLESYPEFQQLKAEITIEDSIPLVLGNQAGLTQCFSNFLGNAVKFVQPGQTPKVRVWAEKLGAGSTEHLNGECKVKSAEQTAEVRDQMPNIDKQVVRIWVEDNGIGIPKQYQDKIWVMFQKLNKKYDGTGIGLALVRKVVQRMKGRVGVESEPGQGSRFWIELQEG